MLKTVHSSTRNAFTSQGPQRSSILSLRCNGLSDRQNIMCRVIVPIVDYSAFGTSPFTNRQRQGFYNVSTIKAPLTGRKESVDFNQFLSVPLALVLQHTNERAETSIADRTGKTMVLYHTANVQIFGCNEIESAYKIGSDFLEIVVPRVCYGFLQFSHRDSRSFSSSAPFLASCMDFLQSSQFPEFGLQMLRIGDTLAIRQRGETVDAKIDTNRGMGFGEMLNNFIKHQGNVVPASGRLGYRDRGRTTSECSAPSNVKVAELSNGKDSTFVLESAHRVLRSLFASLLLERRILSTLVEESLKCGLEMPQSLLRRDRRNFFKPSRFICMAKFSEDSRGSNVVDLFSVSVSICSDSQHRVVGPPAGAKHPRKHRGLSRCRVKPEPLAHLHKNSVQLLRIKVNRKEMRSLCRLKSAVSAHDIQ